MNRLSTIFCLLLLTPVTLFPQVRVFPKLTSPYLGQEPPGLVPEVFAPGIISLQETREYVCIFSPSMDMCIFDRQDDEHDRHLTLISDYVDGRWSEPVVDTVLSRNGFIEPAFSADGTRLFFTSMSLPDPDNVGAPMRLYVMERDNDGWSEPEYLGVGVHASTTNDGTVYWCARTYRGDHLAMRPFDGNSYGQLELLGDSILSDTEDCHPCIATDGSYIVFDSDDRKRIGDCYLFVSFQNDSGTWSSPYSLGDYIKMPASMPRISPDGKYLFFKSEGDIYWVNAKIIEELKPDEFK